MNEQKTYVQAALAELKMACHPAMVPQVVALQKELDKELDQLRQRLARYEARIDGIVEIARAIWPEVATLESAWDAMAASRMDAEQDARRYRWLRDNAASAPGNTPCPYRWTNSDVPETVNGDFLDSEIDAAMRAAIDASGEST